MSQSDTPAVEPDGHRHSRRRRHSHRGNATRGRIYLIIFLLLSRAYDAWNLTTMDSYTRDHLLHSVAPLAFVDTALFVALLFRQSWARYGLILFQMYLLSALIIFFPVLIDKMAVDHELLARIIFAGTLHAVIIWALICWTDIRRLTSRGYE
jgi:hypothetical protein